MLKFEDVFNIEPAHILLQGIFKFIARFAHARENYILRLRADLQRLVDFAATDCISACARLHNRMQYREAGIGLCAVMNVWLEFAKCRSNMGQIIQHALETVDVNRRSNFLNDTAYRDFITVEFILSIM